MPAPLPAGSFPFAALPPAKWSWRTGQRAFGANRASGRAHAGCDLYAPLGEIIHAVADGLVTRGAYPFYAGTYALEIDHSFCDPGGPGTTHLTARYGEIQAEALVREGEHVAAGQPIARVGHLVGIDVPSPMLHLELYAGTLTGPLTDKAGATHVNGRPFVRRRDLLNPTPYLDAWARALPTPAPEARATVRQGSTGGDVEALQRALRAAGDYGGQIDGAFGAKTRTALVAWQARHGLAPDGVAGPKAWQAIDRAGL